MDTINYIMNALMEPVGGKVRSFCVDYRDAENNYYNRAATVIQPPDALLDPATITQGIIEYYESSGYVVCGIHEYLDGYTGEELEKMAESDIAEARKHVAVIYLDFWNEHT